MREVEDIHKPAIQWLTDLQVPYIYHRPDRRSGIHKGHPDFTILWMRRQIMIECKTPSSKLSADQVNRIDFLRRQGNVVEIARNLSEFQDAVRSILCEGKPAVEAYGACNYPLEACFRELKRAVAAVPGNGTKDLSSVKRPCKHGLAGDKDGLNAGIVQPDKSPPAQKFFIGDWQGKAYVFAADLAGAYRMIRQASVIDIAHLPKLS